MNDELKSRVLRKKGEHEDNSILEKSFQFENINFQLNGLKVLDIGCGFWERSIEVAKIGREVIGIDISKKYIKYSKKLAYENNLK